MMIPLDRKKNYLKILGLRQGMAKKMRGSQKDCQWIWCQSSCLGDLFKTAAEEKGKQDSLD